MIRLLLPWMAGFKPGFYNSPDTPDYLTPARSLIEQGTFFNQIGPEVKRTPGYPLFLAPMLTDSGSYWQIIVCQIIISLATAVIIYYLCLSLKLPPPVAILAMALTAFDPLQVIYSYKLLSETLFTFLVYLSILLLTVWLNHPRRADIAFLACLVLILATFVRPVTYYLNFAIPPILWGVSKLHRVPIRQTLTAVLLALLSLLPLFLWQVRNNRVSGYSGFSAIQETNLYFYNAASVLARLNQKSFYEIQAELGFNHPDQFQKTHPNYPPLTDARIYKYLRQDATKIILRNPWLYTQIHLKGILRMLIDPDIAELFRLTGRYPQSGGLLGQIADQGLLNAVIQLMHDRPIFFWSNTIAAFALLILYLLAIYGMFVLCGQHPAFWILLTLFIYIITVSGGPAALGRFRHPLMPVLMIWASTAFIQIHSRIKKDHCLDSSGLYN